MPRKHLFAILAIVIAAAGLTIWGASLLLDSGGASLQDGAFILLPVALISALALRIRQHGRSKREK
ncbi:hypothetical protein ACFSUD_15970 [Sulfitobacter aestuarii]|uniref:DUF3098 domain-containing protein n=1 Tax=Sulfitobacter aestuarii TaxID=2161676 RepID=A0ABW5U5G1_9RHOB